MNVDGSDNGLTELEGAFRCNDAVSRKLGVRKDIAVVDQSPRFKKPEGEKKGEFRARGESADESTDEAASAAEAGV